MEKTTSIQALSNELIQESESSKKILTLVPTEHFSWKPHKKSMSLGALAIHIAELGGWPEMIVHSEELDFASGIYKRPQIDDSNGLMEFFKQEIEKSEKALTEVSMEEMNKIWTLRHSEHILMQLPKQTFIRSMCFNHIYHHRGQLSVYLRMLDINIPGMYGPSADEM